MTPVPTTTQILSARTYLLLSKVSAGLNYQSSERMVLCWVPTPPDQWPVALKFSITASTPGSSVA